MDTGKSALGLDGNVAAALGYPIGIIAIISVIMEKENNFVKFHAIQSLCFHVAMIILMIALWIIGAILLRSEEHTSELQSLAYLVCRLLLEKKKKKKISFTIIIILISFIFLV